MLSNDGIHWEMKIEMFFMEKNDCQMYPTKSKHHDKINLSPFLRYCVTHIDDCQDGEVSGPLKVYAFLNHD